MSHLADNGGTAMAIGDHTCVTSGARSGAMGAQTASIRPVLMQLKTTNAGLHDKAVKKGVYYAFSDGKKPLELLDVEQRLNAGQPVKLTVIEYEKASGWLIGAAVCLGGSWPVLDGANLKHMRFALKRDLASPADLVRAHEDAQLI